ncbi:MAG TPA: thiamine-phosphate kinase [Planctomycetota bacterium]
MNKPSGNEERLHALFRQAFRAQPGVGAPGDDCARLSVPAGGILAVSADQVVAGVHTPLDATPEALARKLLRRSLSDLAPAGATPWAVFWTATVPADHGSAWLERLARAFLAEAELFEVAVAGGDLSTGPAVVLSCTVLGLEGKRPAPGRGGAKAGDRLVVTGNLGNAVGSGRHMLPQPRLAAGRRLVQEHCAHAAIDLSDGLGRDLPRLLQASGVGAHVELEALPLAAGLDSGPSGWKCALEEGEDYELLAALPAGYVAGALADPELAAVGLQMIGEVTAGTAATWTVRGEEFALPAGGWEHRWS